MFFSGSGPRRDGHHREAGRARLHQLPQAVRQHHLRPPPHRSLPQHGGGAQGRSRQRIQHGSQVSEVRSVKSGTSLSCMIEDDFLCLILLFPNQY